MQLKFGKRSENSEQEKVSRDAQDAYDDAVGAALTCLQHELFEKYREEYEILEKKIFTELLWIDKTIDDPVKYGFAVKDSISKLRHIGSLLRGVIQDAGKNS